MSDRGRFYCLADGHFHQDEMDEIVCSASFQLDQAEAKIAELEAELIAVEKNCDYWADKCKKLERLVLEHGHCPKCLQGLAFTDFGVCCNCKAQMAE